MKTTDLTPGMHVYVPPQLDITKLYDAHTLPMATLNTECLRVVIVGPTKQNFHTVEPYAISEKNAYFPRTYPVTNAMEEGELLAHEDLGQKSLRPLFPTLEAAVRHALKAAIRKLGNESREVDRALHKALQLRDQIDSPRTREAT